MLVIGVTSMVNIELAVDSEVTEDASKRETINPLS